MMSLRRLLMFATLLMGALSIVFGSWTEGGEADPAVLGSFKIPPNRPGFQGSLRAPREVVVGFPIIVGIQVDNAASYRKALSVFDFAFAGGITDASFWFAGEEGDDYRLRRVVSTGTQDGFGFERYEEPAVWIDHGESVSMWFDVVQVMSIPPGTHSSSRHGEFDVRNLLLPGDWDFLFRQESLRINFGPTRFEVRPPNEQEEDVRKRIERELKSTCWFPGVLTLRWALPTYDHLPPTTRRIMRLVDVLRQAVHSHEDGLRAIREAETEDWSYLEGLVRQVEYECLLQLDQLVAAEKVAESLCPGNIQQIKKHHGLIANLRTVMSRADKL